MRTFEFHYLFELVIALHLWAFSFNASRFALDGFLPLQLSAIRFILAVLLGAPLVVRARISWREHRRIFWLSAPAGMILGLALGLQLLGLKGSTVAATSFITALYVIFVPALEWLIWKKNPGGRVLWVLPIALLGAALISNAFSATINWNDLFTLAGSLLSGIHILIITAVGRRPISSLAFNVHQSIWAAFATLPFIMLMEGFNISATRQAWVWVFLLVIGVNLIAFSIQVRVQRLFSATSISLIYLVESPLASIMAYFWFAERLDAIQWAGAALILATAAVATISSKPSLAPAP